MSDRKPPIRVGISSCLLGEPVRYDGGHKLDPLIIGPLGHIFEWVAVCPEVELGLGIPRDTLRLVGSVNSPRMIVERTGVDYTAEMQHYAMQRIEQLSRLALHGYILKSNSPSCGMEAVEVHGSDGGPQPRGRGLFAAVLMKHLPDLPIAEEVELRGAAFRARFIERVRARYHREG